MNKLSIALTAILMLALAALLMPNILALHRVTFNRGTLMRNVAIWLAIFAGLGLIYQNFGPGKSKIIPMLSGTMQPQQSSPPASDKDNGNQGFTPPTD